MKVLAFSPKLRLVFGLLTTTVLFAGSAAVVTGQTSSSVSPAGRIAVTQVSPHFLRQAGRANKATVAAPSVTAASQAAISISTDTPSNALDVDLLPVWSFNVKAGRDGDHHSGTMVGTDPFHNPGTSRIPTHIIPLVIRTHTVATGYDPTTGNFTTAPGINIEDPTRADNTCLASPNNVPLSLAQQSPVIQPAHFVFGGVDAGTTQYVDAFQRANFWNVLGSKANQYHVLLSPVSTTDEIVLDVPANEGMAITDPQFFVSAYGFTFCAPMVIVDINWFDAYVNGTLIPRLAESGVNPQSFPIFLTYNTSWASPVTNLFYCCAIGYHGDSGNPIATQTYGVVDWDNTGFFSSTGAGIGAEVMSHEVAEWVNDPYVVNQTPPWGNTGQVSGCDNLLEVGDPLTGTLLPPVTMPNGYSYSLQELVFFSWFEGGAPTGANGWFSDNGTFATNAGPVCP